MEWIKIEDQLPKDGQKVIYYFDLTGISVGFYERVEYPKEFTGSTEPVYGNQFGGKDGFLTDDVTHWMPWPEPPK